MSKTQQKIDFILELEKLKGVLRKTKPVGQERFENSAEHSWQTTLTAMILLDEADADIDVLKVLKMLLIHDVVEIDAGDVFVYDTSARAEIAEQEAAAAERIFGMLPQPMGDEMLALWHEFEGRQTPESKFAKAVDRVNPVIQNLTSDGQSWVENHISRDRVLAMNNEIEAASPELWAVLKARIEAFPFPEDQ
ncbi:MAG: HD domain-containing protein [Hyphomicrobiales bacterium]|nr:HD domain-containing protein [Hyphomicrobiales bacterium]